MSERNPIELAFNPDTMTVRDMKAAVQCLRGILMDFDRMAESEYTDPHSGDRVWTNDATYDFALRVLQVRRSYEVE
jgi:hypothetical protein